VTKQTESSKPSAAVAHTWLPADLAEQLKAQAELERRSVSSVIRIAVEDKLRSDEQRRP
jgi:Ribbon-helix-helix protein, copG family